MTALAIGLALAAACCFGVAAWLQQATVHAITHGAGLRLAGWRTVLRAPKWVSGFGLIALGALLHTVALGLAPLVVVQPIGVLAIALTAILAGRSRGTRVGRVAATAIAASTLGIGAFVLLAATNASTEIVPDGAETSAVLVVGAIVVFAGLLGTLTEGRLRCLAYAAAAGACYGLVAVLVHASAVRIESYGLREIHLDTVLTLAAALLVGGWFVQHAYAAGPPQVVVACQTVLDPMLAVGIGIGLFGETGNVSPAAATGLALAGIGAVVGVVILARTATPSTPDIRPPDGDHLRVVIGADTFPPDVNGAAQFGARLATGLAGLGHEVHVLCPAASGADDTDALGDATVHRAPSIRTPFHPTFRICLPWQANRAANTLLDEVQPDVVHVQAHFLVGRALVHAARRRGIPVVATNHFMPENLYGHAHIPQTLQHVAARVGWWDLRRVLRDAAVITAPTPRAVELLAHNGMPGALAVSCGIDLVHFGQYAELAAGPDMGERRVLFVGRLDEEKRVDELLRAVALIVAEDRDHRLRLDLVGDGSRRAAWQALAVALRIDSLVTFHGFVDEPTLLVAYAGCDVFCMPGIAELQSLATMEAMAAGKPVIAADAMALPHLVRPGRNGWLYPPGDVPALTARLRELLDDPAMVTKMGRASREIIAEHGLPHTLAEFDRLYRQACGRPVATSPVPTGVTA
ncbi:MAG TPA: glycosyltransferase [Pseudonocardiaceae bacterium]|nr:glycosyltransferase [Pseudonocardiaceae bacterium]